MHVPPQIIGAAVAAAIKTIGDLLGKREDRKAEDARLTMKAAAAERSMQRWRAAFIGLAIFVGALAAVWLLVA